MDTKELAKKSPMASPGFTTITPKAETDYEKKILEEQEKQMMDCCGGGVRHHGYAPYGYKPRPKNPSQDADTESTPDTVPQSVLTTDKKSGKR